MGQGKDGLVQLVWKLDGPGTQLAGRLFPISRGVAQPTTYCCGGGAGGSGSQNKEARYPVPTVSRACATMFPWSHLTLTKIPCENEVPCEIGPLFPFHR